MKIKIKNIIHFISKNKNFSILIFIITVFLIFLFINILNFNQLNNKINTVEVLEKQISKNYNDLMIKYKSSINENKLLKQKYEEKKIIIQTVINNQEVIKKEIINVQNSIDEIKDKINKNKIY